MAPARLRDAAARLGALATHPLVWLGAILILVRPFGDYPVNDDWQYAWCRPSPVAC
jgi:hypothetical protein